jgi:hypothetical protein
LCQMQSEERNEKRYGYHHEKRQTGHSRRLPDLQDQDVQNRQSLDSKFLITIEGWIGRNGDFTIEDVAIHVTTMPTPA